MDGCFRVELINNLSGDKNACHAGFNMKNHMRMISVIQHGPRKIQDGAKLSNCSFINLCQSLYQRHCAQVQLLYYHMDDVIKVKVQFI